MSLLSEYKNRYANIRFERRAGVLLMALHTDGGPLKWGALDGSIHTQLGDAFYQVGRDDENRVIILTGTGAAFCDGMNMAELPHEPMAKIWPRLQREGKDMLNRLLEIEVPVIGAINGAAYIHAELLALSDIVLAGESAEIADLAHFVYGVVPSDGVQIVWPMLLGTNRGRYFLLTGQRLSAQAALDLGVVAEVLPDEQLLARAWELAAQLAQKPLQTLRYTRVALTEPIRRRMHSDLAYGLALEGLAGIAAQASS